MAETPKRKPLPKPADGGPQLLSGGNPQIAKGDGDAPVQAWIAAAPGWKGEVGRRIDDLVVATVPGVAKAMRWNSPFYGTDLGWFMNMHCFTRFVRVAFFNGVALDPLPPGASKDPKARYLDIPEDDTTPDAQIADWIRQAAAAPGWVF